MTEDEARAHCRETDEANYWDVVRHMTRDHDLDAREVADVPTGRLRDRHRELHFPRPKPVPCPTCGSLVAPERIGREDAG